MKTNSLGLYCHIPFCVKKCAYCDFYSLSCYEKSDRYIECLLKEAKLYQKLSPNLSFDTVYLGGGTPSSLTAVQLDKLLNGLFQIFSVERDAEVTMEANPATLDPEKLSVLTAAGVNRISIGLQSASDSELKTLSRIHSFSDFEHTYQVVQRYINNISLDLMYGLPEQTLSLFRDTLTKVISLDPSHISLYALKIEEGTPFDRIKETLLLPDDDTVSDMYLMSGELLDSAGYLQYEISNYAKHGRLSKHNLRYWEGKSYIGLGPSAHSYWQGIRYANSSDLDGYIRSLSNGTVPVRSEEYHLDQNDLLEEAIILPLRTTRGLDVEGLQLAYGYDIRNKLSPYLLNGFMVMEGSFVKFTRKGFLVSNSILSDLLPL